MCIRDSLIRGIGYEMIERLVKSNRAIGMLDRTEISSKENWPDLSYTKFGPRFDPEGFADLALEMVEQENIKLLLHTLVVDSIVRKNRIVGIVVENKSGRQAVTAKVVIDATGDADVSKFAGVPYEKLDRDKLYVVGIGFKLANVDTDKFIQYVRSKPDNLVWAHFPKNEIEVPEGIEKQVIAVFEKAKDEVVFEREEGVDLHLRSKLGWITIYSGLKKGEGTLLPPYVSGDGTDVQDLTKTEIVMRRRAVESLEWARKNIPGYESCHITGKELAIGVRETRRIIGEYVLTGEDVMQGRKFEDAIGRSMVEIDRHMSGEPRDSHMLLKNPYEIPYRCLIPKKIDNLIVVGRCISCDHLANGSVREVPVCWLTGQAGGTAAALATKTSVMPRKLDVSLLQKTLREQEVVL